MVLPTQNEINIYNSPDEITAVKHFYNKNLVQAELLFREDSLNYCQDLMWVGPVAFDFYLQAVINYLESEYSVSDSDIVNCLSSIIKYRRKEKELSLYLDKVNKVIFYVINNYNKFEIDNTIYGDLLKDYKEIELQLKEKG